MHHAGRQGRDAAGINWTLIHLEVFKHSSSFDSIAGAVAGASENINAEEFALVNIEHRLCPKHIHRWRHKWLFPDWKTEQQLQEGAEELLESISLSQR